MATKKITKTFVKFLRPGSFYPEEDSRVVLNRSFDLDIPEACFCFSFYDMNYVEVDGTRYTGKSSNHTGRYYVEPKAILDDEGVQREVPNNEILLSNMRGNGWPFVIQTRVGNFQPLEPGDKFVRKGKGGWEEYQPKELG